MQILVQLFETVSFWLRALTSLKRIQSGKVQPGNSDVKRIQKKLKNGKIVIKCKVKGNYIFVLCSTKLVERDQKIRREREIDLSSGGINNGVSRRNLAVRSSL